MTRTHVRSIALTSVHVLYSHTFLTSCAVTCCTVHRRTRQRRPRLYAARFSRSFPRQNRDTCARTHSYRLDHFRPPRVSPCHRVYGSHDSIVGCRADVADPMRCIDTHSSFRGKNPRDDGRISDDVYLVPRGFDSRYLRACLAKRHSRARSVSRLGAARGATADHDVSSTRVPAARPASACPPPLCARSSHA